MAIEDFEWDRELAKMRRLTRAMWVLVAVANLIAVSVSFYAGTPWSAVANACVLVAMTWYLWLAKRHRMFITLERRP